LGFILLFAVAAFAAPKSASAYYGDAAFQYIENRLPTAEITCNEGLQYYPNDQKLQMLLDRIHEAKDEQKNENKKNDPKNDQNQNDQNQDQDKQNQDQNKDQQNQDQQNQDQNQNGDQSSSSSQNDQNQDQQNQGQNGQSSSSEGGQSSDSNGGTGEQPQQPEQPEGGSSDSNGSDQEEPQPLAPGELTPEEAAQLLKDFDEQNGERKPWKPVRGQARPVKDW
jgi:site-specific DNA-cytosine methylase